MPSAFFEDGWEFHSYIETEAKPGETVKAELLADLGKLDLVAVQPLAPDVFAGEDAAYRGGPPAVCPHYSMESPGCAYVLPDLNLL